MSEVSPQTPRQLRTQPNTRLVVCPVVISRAAMSWGTLFYAFSLLLERNATSVLRRRSHLACASGRRVLVLGRTTHRQRSRPRRDERRFSPLGATAFFTLASANACGNSTQRG